MIQLDKIVINLPYLPYDINFIDLLGINFEFFH